jgi:hypothetical protein
MGLCLGILRAFAEKHRYVASQRKALHLVLLPLLAERQGHQRVRKQPLAGLPVVSLRRLIDRKEVVQRIDDPADPGSLNFLGQPFSEDNLNQSMDSQGTRGGIALEQGIGEQRLERVLKDLRISRQRLER